MIKIKRIYEDYLKTDGYRILVDRLWPRGISKEHAKIDLWIKEITPSSDLRKWYHNNLENREQFQKKYVVELDSLFDPWYIGYGMDDENGHNRNLGTIYTI